MIGAFGWNTYDERDFKNQQYSPSSPMAYYPGSHDPLVIYRIQHIIRHHILCRIQLASAGCLHTAVALELSARQAQAAESTRTQGGPTIPFPPPAEWAVRANPASNLKCPSVAFGIRRPTRTPTRSDPRWKGRLLRAGLEPQSPEYRRPAAGRPEAPAFAPATPRPRPAIAADSARGLAPGRRGNPRPGR